MAHKPHPANVPGDFYVEDNCCTMCMLPFSEAPELIGEVDDPRGCAHCYVKRQPRSLVETERMLSAVRVAELGCFRYRGHDRAIQSQLVESGEGWACDFLAAELLPRAAKLEAEAVRERKARAGSRWKRFFAWFTHWLGA